MEESVSRRLSRTRTAALAGCVIFAGYVAAGGTHVFASGPNTHTNVGTGLLQSIKKAGVLKVGIAVDPPFCLQTPSGSWYSFNPVLMQLAAKQLGVKVDFVTTGWPTIVAGLQAGKYDIIGASISATPARQKAINFTVPYAYGGTSWIVARSGHLNSLAQLNSSSVTIAFSTNTFQQEITQKMMPKAQDRALPNASYAQLLSEIVASRSQAAAIPSFLVPAILQRYPQIKSIPAGNKGVDPTGVAWGIRKGVQNYGFLQYMTKFIKKEKANGTINRLMKKYITIANSLK